MIPLALDSSALDERRRDAQLGFYDRQGRRICRRCYFRMSLLEDFWRIALTHVSATANDTRDLLVSTIWTGCDPDAVHFGRDPMPFVTAVMDVHTQGGDLTTVRSRTLDEARHTHDDVASRLTDPVVATTLRFDEVGV